MIFFIIVIQPVFECRNNKPLLGSTKSITGYYFRMIDKQSDIQVFPNEIWLKIFTFLDLKTQKLVTSVSKSFLSLVVSIWKTKVIKLKPRFSQINADYKSVKLKVVMNAFLDDKVVPIDQFTPTDLYEVLSKYQTLSTPENLAGCDHGYAFFHDYDRAGCKFLELRQKWPRPGAKSLEKFINGNKAVMQMKLLNFYIYIDFFNSLKLSTRVTLHLA